MATSYPYTVSISDTAAFVTYIQRTFATITSATNDGTTVTLTFSAALTSPEQTTLNGLVTSYVVPSSSAIDVSGASSYNSTSTALASSGVFTGAWENISQYGSLTFSVTTDQVGSLAVQYGFTSQAANLTKTYAIAASTPVVKINSTAARWMRVVYTNGATLQTSFSLQTRWSSVMQQMPIVMGADTLDDTNDFVLTKAVVAGKTDRGQYSFARIDEDNRLRVRPITSVFGHVASSASTLVVQASFMYNLNTTVISTAVTGSGAVTQASGQAIVSSGAAATSSGTLTTDRYCRALPGQTVRVIIGCVFSTGVANNTQVCGAGTAANGVFFGYNGVSFGVLYRSNSVDTWIAKTSWNVDKLDGTGPSGMTLDPTKGNLYMIEYDTSGYGTVSFIVNCTGGTTTPVTVHRVDFGNTLTAPGILNACLPCAAISTNTTNTSAKTISVTGFSAYVHGDVQHVGNRQCTESTKTVTTATYVPVITLRNKATFNSISNTSGVFLNSMTVANNGNRVAIISLYDSPTLTSASYADVSTNTSCCDADKAATALSGGVLLFTIHLGAVADQVIDLSMYNFYIPPSGFITVASKCATNGSNALSIALNFREDN